MPNFRPAAPLHVALWLPRFHLQAALTDQEASPQHQKPNQNHKPIALLDSDHAATTPEEIEKHQGRILQANHKAEALGITSGMTASQALARCVTLRLLTRNAAAEHTTQATLLECAANWTPTFESTQPGLALLDLTNAAPQVRQQLHHHATGMHQWLANRHLDARIGIASKPDQALLAAHAATPILIWNDHSPDHQQTALLLQRLPISILHPSPALAEVLHLWGIHTLAQLQALPRSDIASRLGNEGLWLWDMASGGRHRLLQLVRPVVGYLRELELDYPMESLEPLLFILRRFLGELCQQLASAWMLASAQTIQLRFDDHTLHEKTLRIAEPTRDADLLLRLLHTHLESLTANAPIIAISLALIPTKPSGQQSNLFERSLRDPNRLAETLSQLEALLGPGNVGKVHLLPSRRSDAFTVVNYLETSPPPKPFHTRPSPSPETSHGLPLRRYRPPRQVWVSLENDQPHAIQTSSALLQVTAASGPWLVSGDWWDHSIRWERMIWEIATHDGGLYQLAQEPKRWVLDGIFG